MTDIDYTKWEYPESDLEVLDEMNGYVSEISESRKTFWINCVSREGENLEVEMPCSHIPVLERPYFQEGAYCRLRLYKDPNNEDKAIEEFIFNKRIWSKEELENAQKRAQELAWFLNNNEKNTAS